MFEQVIQYELETWTRCAEGYLDTFAGLTGEMIPHLVKLAEITDGSCVLDLGSGPGHVANAFALAGACVTGVDLSSKMVEIAQTTYQKIKFKEARAEEIPFNSESFDVVVSNYVVHHFAQPEIVFHEIYRVLKPGGRFIFAVWGAPEDQSSIGAFFEAVGTHHKIEEFPHGPLFGVTEKSFYEPLLTQAGLNNFQLDLHELTWKVSSIEPILQGYFDWANITTLPKDIQQNIKATMVEKVQQYKQGEGFVFPHTAIVGSAVKL